MATYNKAGRSTAALPDRKRKNPGIFLCRPEWSSYR